MMNFAIIAPFQDLKERIAQLCRYLKLDVPIAVGDLNDGVTEAGKILKAHPGIEVIVSRGGTAKLIASSLDIPVVEIEVNHFDLIKAIDAAKK